MQINLIVVGKTQEKFLINGEAEYHKRLKRYISFKKIEIPDLKQAKKLTENQIKTEEGKLILDKINPSGLVVLLDDKGKMHTSMQFSKWIQAKMNRGYKHITFIVGGAYGFSEDVYRAADEQMSLSKMTFSHQMIRLFFTEQVYRAFTILRNEPYHHE
ncbi:23S rRNA (pseudouridine(1915)-N(3))-methyltransferase RlmH [Crocinitomix algicola]|uniref:23S rRNA (pseudouridine(1915)-N(3))-methyltransferase RlmH n=1 Tax=Crocinitomix algicola TaxID=1740263 RepID=UPI0008733C5D|nr:23S rRNA (pseudouridine(1915)-N(3))-methyltransferase RlmH [Crocinitomix algicola]